MFRKKPKDGIRLQIPGFGDRQIDTVLSDYDGPLSCNGKLETGLKDQLIQLADLVEIHILTADKKAKSADCLAALPVTVHILGEAHNRERVARQEFPTARCVVFGHSHIPWNEDHNGQLLFNPGSATDRRRQPRCSIGLLYVDDDVRSVRGEIIYL